MSSVQSFLRQIPVGQSLYANNSLLEIAAAACVFVPGTGNYVGNYPPGLVAPASADVKGAIANAAQGYSPTVHIVRDMGKTIYAETATTLANAVAGTGSGESGYFRQVQVLVPQPIKSVQGFIGGVAGSAFGVVGGSPDPYSSYLTVYVPTSVAGVYAFPSGVVGLPNGPQGQM
jgi:hypothetical protein